MLRSVAMLVFFGLLVKCQKSKDPFPLLDALETDRLAFGVTSETLVSEFVEGGFGVVTRKPDGSSEHRGESLLWGGTSLWALSCEAGADISAAMAKMIEDQGGAMVRAEPIGEYENGRQVTLDGAIGALLGIARRVQDCGEVELWRRPMELMIAFQDANGGRLHPDVESRLDDPFTYSRDMIAAVIGLRGPPPERMKRDLEKVAGGWPFAVQLAHMTGQGSDACYRVNLSLDTLLTIETLGEQVTSEGRNQFCANTTGMDIPTVDHYCGRKDIGDYIGSYDPSAWEMRHQRCGAWESPDGDGNRSHQLDKLVAYVMRHGWHQLAGVPN